MLQIKGKYTDATIHADQVDTGVIKQVQALCNLEALKGSSIQLMPDCHVGKSCTVGATIQLNNVVFPELVGSDIGCGVLAIKLKETKIDLPKLDSSIKKLKSANLAQYELYDLKCIKNINTKSAVKSFGTLGGGNHFINLAKNSKGEVYLIVHSGSRDLGAEVAKYYKDMAYRYMAVKTGVKRFTGQLAYLELTDIPEFKGLFEAYLHDINVCRDIASLSRQSIALRILKANNLHKVEEIDTVHNYVDIKSMVLRKGAISAKKGERLVIPINPLEGILICTGIGNKDFNESAPHGAGRICSRSEAKSRFILSEYKKELKANKIFTTTIVSSNIDECSHAYKSLNQIKSQLEETATIEEKLNTVYLYKSVK